jgi:hypothetical protein
MNVSAVGSPREFPSVPCRSSNADSGYRGQHSWAASVQCRGHQHGHDEQRGSAIDPRPRQEEIHEGRRQQDGREAEGVAEPPRVKEEGCSLGDGLAEPRRPVPPVGCAHTGG